MHRNMLAHRDIKPENAFISSIGVVKVRASLAGACP
jgi:serine/threonine protein kinase